MTNKQSEIYQRLPARHVPEFEERMLDRGMTIDALREWLGRRGCAASRAAVGRCVKRFRENERLSGFCPESIGASDRQRRANAVGWVNQLSGPELAAVALFAGTLAHAKRPSPSVRTRGKAASNPPGGAG